MKSLKSEQNSVLVDHPERVEAKKEVDDIMHHIEADTKSGGSAQYLLTVLPPLLKKLETAYVRLITIEAQIGGDSDDQT